MVNEHMVIYANYDVIHRSPRNVEEQGHTEVQKPLSRNGL